MAYSDTIQRQYRDIIEQVRRKYPDTDELDDRIEYELRNTYKDKELLSYHHFIVQQQGFKTSTLTKRSPVADVTSSKDDEPPLPHAVETQQRLQAMADQLNPELAMASVVSKYRALMGTGEFEQRPPTRTREPSTASGQGQPQTPDNGTGTEDTEDGEEET